MTNVYESVLGSRYAGKDMQYIFSYENKIKTWRKLWIALAKAQKQLGLDITDEQIQELEKFKDDINFDVANAREKEVRHDVMAHIYAYGVQCPKAKPIIHLGATSCYVGDNTDIILSRQALFIVQKKLVNIIRILSDFAQKYKDVPTLAYTHLQTAQPTTVGKRACLWINDLVMDLKDLGYRLSNISLLGSKGTTGTQASFKELFNNDEEKVFSLDMYIAEYLGFDNIIPVSGQTYSRKIDSQILDLLSQIAQSAYKFSNDIRFLQHLKEIEEPFASKQVGSSAMAYKRNPMRSERMAALCRYVIVDALNTDFTAASQFLERTLDDSANKRISIPEAFLAIDGILNLYSNIADGLIVYENVINKHLEEELPFMMTENILMNAVKKGGDRQQLHEKIRVYSMQASENIKAYGKENNLLDMILQDPSFNLTKEELEYLKKPNLYSGMAARQTEIFLDKVRNIIGGFDPHIAFDDEVSV